MNGNVEYHRLTPVDSMRGEDDEETGQLREMLEDARAYLGRQKWCHSVRSARFGLGIGGVVGVFLFEVTGDLGVDSVLWVVSGDLPAAYLVTDAAPTPVEALSVYCDIMEAWVHAARGEGSAADVCPVEAALVEANARRLETRVAFLRREVIPLFQGV